MRSLQPNKKLVDQVYEIILRALSDGTFAEGERITQEQISTRLNVSRQPVTHALAVLKAQGFVAPSARRGLTVASVGSQFFKEIYELRSALEPLAVSLATKRVTREALGEGREIIQRGLNSVAAKDPSIGLQADIDFHAFIYEQSGNSLISESMRLHWYRLRRAMIKTLRQPGMSVAAWHEHERILEEMTAGNAEGAALMMKCHLLGAFQRSCLR